MPKSRLVRVTVLEKIKTGYNKIKDKDFKLVKKVVRI
jgi:hypothetical protein